MLGEVFQRFVEKSPVSVMVGGLLERVLSRGKLDELFESTAECQYTRKLLFSILFDLMSQVVCGIRRSVHAAYQASVEEISVSITSVYNKLNGVETETSASLVRYSAREVAPIIGQMGGALPPLLPGFRTKILDGNCIEGTQHRLKELRNTKAGALPGKSLVVLDPAMMLAVDVIPCENGHTQERALLEQVLSKVEVGDLWIADRNFCTLKFLFGIAEREAYFIIREHQLLPWEAVGPMEKIGRVDSGMVHEQPVRLKTEEGGELLLRRVWLHLDQPTCDGEEDIYLLTNLLEEVADAKAVADLYRHRWTIERAFQELAEYLNSEINTLGYPKAALFGFCAALVAYNVLSVVKASLRSVHGAEKIEKEVSGYYLADEIAGTYRGMMIAIPEEEWGIFSQLTVPQMAEVLQELAGKVKLSAFRKHPRGPKKPSQKGSYDKRQPHVATAKLIAQRKAGT